MLGCSVVFLTKAATAGLYLGNFKASLLGHHGLTVGTHGDISFKFLIHKWLKNARPAILLIFFGLYKPKFYGGKRRCCSKSSHVFLLLMRAKDTSIWRIFIANIQVLHRISHLTLWRNQGLRMWSALSIPYLTYCVWSFEKILGIGWLERDPLLSIVV